MRTRLTRGVSWYRRVLFLLFLCHAGFAACQSPPTQFGEERRPWLVMVARPDPADPARYIGVYGDDLSNAVALFRDGVRVRPTIPQILQQGDEMEMGRDVICVWRYPIGDVYIDAATRVRVGSLDVLFGKIFARVRGAVFGREPERRGRCGGNGVCVRGRRRRNDTDNGAGRHRPELVEEPPLEAFARDARSSVYGNGLRSANADRRGGAGHACAAANVDATRGQCGRRSCAARASGSTAATAQPQPQPSHSHNHSHNPSHSHPLYCSPRRNRQPQLPPIILPPFPHVVQSGYCCDAAGRVYRSTLEGCRGGLYESQAEANRRCERRQEGYCCANGKGFRERPATMSRRLLLRSGAGPGKLCPATAGRLLLCRRPGDSGDAQSVSRQFLHRRGECPQGMHGAAFTHGLLLRRRQGFADHAGSLQWSLRAREAEARRMPGAWNRNPTRAEGPDPQETPGRPGRELGSGCCPPATPRAARKPGGSDAGARAAGERTRFRRPQLPVHGGLDRRAGRTCRPGTRSGKVLAPRTSDSPLRRSSSWASGPMAFWRRSCRAACDNCP